jgi:hypothetical protein
MNAGVAIYPEEIKLARLNHWRRQLKSVQNRPMTKKGMIAVVQFLLQNCGKAYGYAEVVAALKGRINHYAVEKALYELTLIKAICHARKHGGYWIPTVNDGEPVPHDELGFWEGCTTSEVSITDFFNGKEEED